MVRRNESNQPIGELVPEWTEVPLPSKAAMNGNLCKVEGLSVDKHALDLYEAFSEDVTGGIWTYMTVGPFSDFDSFRNWVEEAVSCDDPQAYAIVDLESNKAVGTASYLRMQPAMGVIEVGQIVYAPCMQRTPLATEAMLLMAQRVFNELGYRRYEWKCDDLNAPSKRAAERLGFSYDGLFEQAIVYKGRNRDTAWYSILDKDWPRVEAAYKEWLKPENFSNSGSQRKPLSAFLNA